MTKFLIQLPNERARTYRMVTLFVMALHVFMFGLLISKASPGSKGYSLCWMGLTVSTASLLIVLFQQFRRSLLTYKPEIAFFILSMAWFILSAWLQGSVVLLVAIMGFIASKKPVVCVDEEQVSFPGFPAKTWRWEQISNLVLRDDVLTIDLADKGMIQTVIDTSVAGQPDEEQFNLFCRRQLQR